jgi:hypothetical protein
MQFTVVECEQRSAEWHRARVGRLTGTCAADLLAKIKVGEAAVRRDLRTRLVCERLTGMSQESGFVNADMQRGVDKEPEAIAAYEAHSGLLVSRTGFLSHNALMAGCSLDGHFGEFKGILELKCPKSATHLRYLRAGVAPTDYLPQIRHNLWITGAEWCEFVSFDDRFPAELQLFVVRVRREAVDIPGYESEAKAFLAEVDREFADVQALARKAVA